MNGSLRFHFLQVACCAALLGFARPSEAHFLWLKAAPADGQTLAMLFFGENADDEAYHLPEKLAAAKIWRRTPDGQRTELKTESVETDDRIGLVAPLVGDGPSVLEAAEQYGVYEEWLLTYYAKHVQAASNGQLAKAGPSKDLKLDIVPRASGDELELIVLWDGKPRPHTKATITVGDAEPIEKTTDEQGKITLLPAGEGLVSVRVSVMDDSVKGELDDIEYTSGMNVVTLTVPWRSGKPAAKPQAKEGADHSTKTSDRIPPLPEGVASFGGAVADGWLYVYGGHTGTEHAHSAANLSSHFRRVQLGSTGEASGTQAWEELPMQTPLQGLPLVSHGGKLYRAGGLSVRNATTDDEEDLHSITEFASYDPATGQWTDLTPLPAPRSSHDAVVIGDKLFVVGGWTLSGTSDGEWLERSLVFDLANPDAGWQKLPEQSFQRRALAAAEWHGKLVALGGMDENADVSPRVDFFDPTTGKWSEGPNLPGRGIAGFGVSAWNLDGELYVSGMRGVVYRLNDEGSDWEEVAKLGTPRFFHRLLPGGDDSLLAVGGASRKGHLTDIEEIDVKSTEPSKETAADTPAASDEANRQSSTIRQGAVRFASQAPSAEDARPAEVRLALVEQPCPGHIWPAFRGQGNSLTRAQNLPLRWSDDEHVAWTAELPGYGQSSPVVWDGAVFITTMQGENKETPTVLCFDLATGELRWQREFKSSQETPANNYVTRSSPTAVVDADRVVVFFESGDLLALDHAGNTLWQRSLVKEYGPFEGKHGVGSSLAATDDAVIVLANHEGPSYLLAADKSTGANRWKVDYDPRVAWSSPVVSRQDGKDLIVVSAAGTVEAYDATTGTRRWTFDGLSGNNVPSATVVGDRVFVGAQDVGSNVALVPDGQSAEVAWRSDDVTCNFSSPLYHDGLVYFVNRSGVAFCADAQSGDIIWKQRLGDTCWASPLAATDRIYFFTKGGHSVVIESGREWQPLAENDLTIDPESRVYGVAAVDGALVLRTGSRLICLGVPRAS
jgi:outer membrane protein assembly factor BamB